MNAKFTVRAIQNGQTLKNHSVVAGAGQNGQALVLQAAAHTRYQLADMLTYTSPAKLQIKRVGKDLMVALPGNDVSSPDIVIKDYFEFEGMSISGLTSAGEPMVYDTSSSGGFLASIMPGAATGVTDKSLAPNQTAGASLAKSGGGWFDSGWGLAALGGGALLLAGTGGSKDAPAGIDKIKTYKGDPTKPQPALSDYAGVSGITAANLAGVNSYVPRTTQALDSVGSVQTLVNAYNKVLAEANGTAADVTPDADPVAQDFIDLMGTGATAAILDQKAGAVALLNDRIKALTSDKIDAYSKLKSYADAVNAVSALALDEPSTSGTALATGNITKAQLLLLGAEQTELDKTSFSLTAVSDAMRANAEDLSSLNSTDKIKALVKAYNTILAEANGAAIDTTDVNPSAADYAVIGADIGAAKADTDAGKAALTRLNALLGQQTADKVDTVGEITKLAVSLDKILTVANLATGAALTDAQKFTTEELKNLGLVGFIDNETNNAVLARHFSEAVRDKDEADVVAGVGTGTKLVDGVKTKTDQTQQVRLQALLSEQIIQHYAVDTLDASKTTLVPTLVDWQNAGVFKAHPTDTSKFADLEAADLTALNSAADALSAVQMKASGLQKMADAYFKIIKEANGTAADVNTASNPDGVDYALIGLTGKTATDSDPQHVNAVKLLNALVSGRTVTEVNTVKQLQTLANVADKIYALAALEATDTPTEAQKLTVSEFTSLGLTGFGLTDVLNAAFADLVNTAIQKSDPANMLTGKGQTLIEGVRTDFDQTQLERLQAMVSLETIKNYSNDTTVVPAKTTTVPTVADWRAAGVFKPSATEAGKYEQINSSHLTFLNSAADKLLSASMDTTVKLQTVATSYFTLIAEANGAALADAYTEANPTAQDFVNIGVVAALSDLPLAKGNLLVSLMGEKSEFQVDTVGKIQDLLPTLHNVLDLAGKPSGATANNVAAADATALTVSKLATDLSLQGVNDKNHKDILAAIQNTTVEGADTFSELQSMVSLVRIQKYAEDSAASGGAPTEYDWTHITGVTSEIGANYQAYNTAVNALPAVADGGQLEALVVSYNKILAEANGTSADNTPGVQPVLLDYSNLGLNLSALWANNDGTVDALRLLNDALGRLTSDKVDTYDELFALATAAGKVMDLAEVTSTAVENTTNNNGQIPGLINTAGLTMADLTLLGLQNTGKATDYSGSYYNNESGNIFADIQNSLPVNVSFDSLQNTINARVF